MATILLSAAGAALGGSFGGTVLGLSGAVIGRAVGATVGRVIDQRLLGAGSAAVDGGRIDRIRVMGASEGAPLAQVYGRMRVSGQVIWATRFKETVSASRTRGGGKGGAPKTTVTSRSYSVSLAVALCEGEILRVGRIWADGLEIARYRLNLRVHTGSEDQVPDAKIAAVEGADLAPAYSGVAYVVFEDLDLTDFGNRVPQFSFEVVRAAQGSAARAMTDLRAAVRAVALVPGTGEYALATTPVHYVDGPGVARTANVHAPSGKTDFATSLDQLREELPDCRAVSLVVSWFGDDLRCGTCLVRPKVEQRTSDGATMVWRAGGIGRAEALELPRLDGRPVYGGTPADQSVIEAIRAIRAGGQEVMFYPFVLMEQTAGNALPDPWSGAIGQPALPWRGRITTSAAPGCVGTPDRTAAAEAEVAAFFGTAQRAQFARQGDVVSYSGPDDWRYRRFILHYAHLCAAAGGVEAFCIGSELRGLTQVRGAGDSFPAVAALRALAADVRAILGAGTKISYAADWTEYAGYQADGNLYYPLDPLWGDATIDFVGIDNYMPVSDWRGGEVQADASFGSGYALDYLKANVGGGEGYDWYYASAADAAAQLRTPITDGAHGEPWVFRIKDLRNWWSRPHHERIAGVRLAEPTAWQPEAKPIWFTELGCPAVDNGATEPNRFVDPKSSESTLPRGSTGRRDDLIQMQYLRAVTEFWDDPANNPVSTRYGGPMVDTARTYVWAWDARPYPEFPNLLTVWSDGENYARGHWLNGRAANLTLASVVADLCERAGVSSFDVSGLYGTVRGYAMTDEDTARAALQPLMLAHGFDAVEREGVLQFRMRDGRLTQALDPGWLAVSSEIDGAVETARAAEAELSGRVRLGFVEAEGSFDARLCEAIYPDGESLGTSHSDLPLCLTQAEGQGIVDRWLSESRIGRDTARFALPKSALHLGAGDVVELGGARYRIDRIEQGTFQQVEAVRVEAGVYQAGDVAEQRPKAVAFAAPLPVHAVLLDLPLLEGSEVPHAPHLAVGAQPWPGTVAVWSSATDEGYALNRLVEAPSVIGVTEGPLAAARAGVIDRGPALRVRVVGGSLGAADLGRVLNGANLAAIGADGLWEVFQFCRADLVGPDTYELALRLRGQAGTDGVMPAVWPAGSTVVILDGAPQQIELPQSARGLARHYRVGAAARGYDGAEVVHLVAACSGVGLRPYRPAHLRASRSGADLSLRWVRRTRVDGDGWHAADVPLGEDREAYQVQVMLGPQVLREATVTAPEWFYPAVQRAADGTLAGCTLRVAQLSDRYGPGPFATLEV